MATKTTKKKSEKKASPEESRAYPFDFSVAVKFDLKDAPLTEAQAFVLKRRMAVMMRDALAEVLKEKGVKNKEILIQGYSVRVLDPEIFDLRPGPEQQGALPLDTGSVPASGEDEGTGESE